MEAAADRLLKKRRMKKASIFEIVTIFIWFPTTNNAVWQLGRYHNF
jgi:hypothetical protein